MVLLVFSTQSSGWLKGVNWVIFPLTVDVVLCISIM